MTPEFLAQLIDRHAAALELFAAQWTDSPADVVQDAFMRLIRQRPFPDDVTAWLFRVVRNRAISLKRSRERRRRHETAAAGLSNGWFTSDAENRLDADAAARALDELPDEQREVIIARLWGGLTFEQIAAVAGISSSAAHRRYQAGLEALRKKLGVTWLGTTNSLGQNSPGI